MKMNRKDVIGFEIKVSGQGVILMVLFTEGKGRFFLYFYSLFRMDLAA